MPLNQAKLIAEISEYVKQLFQQNHRSYLVYHNLAHTQSVVAHANEIAGHYSLTQTELFALVAAAWFHDTAILFGNYEGHEQRSARIMLEFLTPKNLPSDILADITSCILATKLSSPPVSLIDQILCDADTYHLGTPQFMKIDELVWDEVEERSNKKIENRASLSLRFLKNHQFFTSFCQEKLGPGKTKNIELLISLGA